MAVGYVLPEDASSVEALQVFPGFPGRFLPGTAVGLEHMGIDEETADALIADQGLPLEKVSLSDSESEAAFIPDEMQAESGFEGESVQPGVPGEEPPGEKPYSEWTVAELDEEFGDVEGYPMEANKPEKVAFAEAQG